MNCLASVVQGKYPDCKSIEELREKLSSEGFSISAAMSSRILRVEFCALNLAR